MKCLIGKFNLIFVVVVVVVVIGLFCSTSQARSTLPNICLQPPPRSEGVCTIEIEGFYFDPRTNDCLMYVIGGCRSSPGQSFGSKSDCLATCLQMTRRIQDLRINE